MVKEAMGTGATIEDARADALKNLSAPENVEIQYDVITYPEEKKFFGLFGGKDAKIRVFYEVSDPVIKEEKKQEKVQKKAKKKVEKKPVKEQKKEEKKEVKEPEKEKKEEKKPEIKNEVENEYVLVKLEECPEAIHVAYDYLNTLIKGIGFENYNVEISKNSREYHFNIKSEEDYSLLIGRRGDTLDSIQYLTRLVANHGSSERKSVRLSINVGDYRQKRERTLKDMARKNGRRVRKYGRKVTLNPMNPAERRIIHTTIAEMEGITSFSVGVENERRVVIVLEDGVKPYNDRPQNRNGGRRNNSRRNSQIREESAENDNNAPKREPKKVAPGVPYGKITKEEINKKKAEVLEKQQETEE